MAGDSHKPASSRVRVNAILLGVLALLIYGGFIFLSWYRGH